MWSLFSYDPFYSRAIVIFVRMCAIDMESEIIAKMKFVETKSIAWHLEFE